MRFRILVAGGAGFIGQHLAAELLKLGHFVRVADNLTGVSSRKPEDPGIDFRFVDLRSYPDALVSMGGMDICFLLAARSSGIGFFNTHPADMLADNLRILCSVFDGACKVQISRLIYISSSCIFDRATEYPVTEQSINSAPAAAFGYPFSKLAGEAMCRAFHAQYGLPYSIVRPFNVYGPGEPSGTNPGDSHVIPDITTAILRGDDPIPILGSGEQRRTFTHVSDLVRGLLCVMNNPNAANEDFNLAGKEELSIQQIAGKLWRLCRRPGQPRFRHVAAYAHDASRRTVDTSKAAKVLGWRPTIDLDTGLPQVVDWIRDRVDKCA